jgi:hypothetical protein
MICIKNPILQSFAERASHAADPTVSPASTQKSVSSRKAIRAVKRRPYQQPYDSSSERRRFLRCAMRAFTL